MRQTSLLLRIPKLLKFDAYTILILIPHLFTNNDKLSQAAYDYCNIKKV